MAELLEKTDRTKGQGNRAYKRPVKWIGGMKMTKVIIISGFLGAGKTSLMMELLRNQLLEKRVVVIENDFGEVEIDESLLKNMALEVENLKAGCICCSLKNHFAETLAHALSQEPDYILIEPSGVARLSEVLAVVLQFENEGKLIFGKAISIVDAKRYEEYFKASRSLFQDQITYADLILVSHEEGLSAEQLDRLAAFLKKLNDEAVICMQSWKALSGRLLLHGIRGAQTFLLDLHMEMRPELGLSQDGAGQTDKQHAARFGHRRLRAVTIDCPGRHTREELELQVMQAIQASGQTILRAKGIVPSANGYLLLQYVKGELKIAPISVEGHCICFIGPGLSEDALQDAFQKQSAS